MTDPLKIEPALSEEEWEVERLGGDGAPLALGINTAILSSRYVWSETADALRGMIALANDTLRSDHPCKLTWAKLDLLREQVEIADPDNARVLAHGAAYDQERADNDAALAFIDALASYLPSREAENG